MGNQEELKRKLQELIDYFKANKDALKEHLEGNIESRLIEPLFRLLGWTEKDWVRQEKTQRGEKRGRVDYAFKIGDKTVFYLEVKKLGVNLDKEANRQVVSYALSKRIPFAVSTNFEEMNIFCVEQEDAIEKNNIFRVFRSPEDYIEKIYNLSLLSKENFEKGIIFEEAELEGKLKKRISIDKYLLSDLMNIRSLIASDIEKNYPNKYQLNEKDEIIQRIIDRLIFIRKCEDTQINPKDVKLEEVKRLSHDKIYSRLKEIFTLYNEVYNSGLFSVGVDNDCDKIKIDGGIIQKLVGYLYESKGEKYIYNFDWIDADVLGQVYEQYLGIILQQTKSGKAKLKEGQAHRKEQGIYYTPTYIVDYIVKNTVGELLKDKKTKIKDLKILDPACGSGSFLIKAFDYLYESLSKTDEAKQHKIDSQGAYSIKTEILKDNLYGVDLDHKAVEITKLNLLLKAAEKERKLPEEVDLHIKQGNSLIDDEKISGLNAFKWDGDFKEETFDVIIGNPPYGVELSKDIQEYLDSKYAIGSTDTAVLFIKKGYTSLKSKGLLGFIVPKAFCFASNWKKIRDLVWNDIINIVDCGKAWKDVKLEQVIFIIKKDSKSKTYTSSKFTEVILTDSSIMNKKDSEEFGFLLNGITKQELIIGQKIKDNSIMLNQVSENQRGAILQKYIAENGELKVIGGAQVQKFGITGIKGRIDRSKIDSDLAYIKDNSLLVQRIVAHIQNPKEHIQITCTIPENKNLILVDTINQITLNKNISRSLIWVILNSKITNWYAYRFIFGKAIRTMQFDNPVTARIPLPKKLIDNQQKLSSLADKLFLLGKKLVQIKDRQTSEKAKLEEEIKKTDQEVDEILYKIYGITEEERKIIEESLK